MVAYIALVLADDRPIAKTGEQRRGPGVAGTCAGGHPNRHGSTRGEAVPRTPHGFGLDTERLMLGVHTALPADHEARLPLQAWLVDGGGLDTVRVFADRVSGSAQASAA